MSAAEPFAYVAYRACGCLFFAGVNVPAMRETVAREIAGCVRNGYRVGTLSVQGVRDGKWSCMDCKQPQGRLAV
jgi:hypothetical protein